MSSAVVPPDSGKATSTVGPYLKAYEVAPILGCTPNAVTQLCRSGELPASKPMKSWLIHTDDLDAYIRAHRNDQAVPA